MKSQFVWAPDTRITEHPIRIAKDNLTFYQQIGLA